MAEKKDERTLEMRVAELESRLGVGAQQMEFTEQEVAAYNKIADALGVGVGPQPTPAPPVFGDCVRHMGRVHLCRVQACRIQTCRIKTCLTPCGACQPHQPSRISQCISQCINQCFACYASDYEADLSGGFGTLGY
jgi:hypothetical protein